MSKPRLAEPTAPMDPEEAERWRFTRAKRRMVYGRHIGDVAAEIRSRVGQQRADAWGTPDMSANPLRRLSSLGATLYDAPWRITHPTASDLDVELVRTALEQASAVPLLQRVQRDTMALREMLLDVRGVVREDDSKGVVLRVVFPDLVVACPDPVDPSVATSVDEARAREIDGQVVWVWDCYERGQPMVVRDYLTRAVIPGAADERLPGLPHVWYHAAYTGALWDAWEGSELYYGSLRVATHWTMYDHSLVDASWPQRYSVNVSWGPEQQEGEEGATHRQVIDADPGIILQGYARQGDRATEIGQWQPGANPKELAESNEIYGRHLQEYADGKSAEAYRSGGDSPSGYALAVNTEEKKNEQRRCMPTFRRSDTHLCARVAEELNALLGTTIPTAGWVVTYWLELLEERVVAEELATRTPATAEIPTAIASPAPDTDTDTDTHTSTTDAPAPAAEGEPLAATALNGAQVTAALEIVASVGYKRLPRASGLGMLMRFFNLTSADAEAIMGEVGRDFNPAPEDGAAQPTATATEGA